MRLSFDFRESFVGDVFAIKLLSDSDISHDDITWSTSSDCITIKSFSDHPVCPFSDGVILTLNKVGDATVTAEHKGIKYTANVNVRLQNKASSEGDLNYYIGDFHDHTCPLNGYDEFLARTEGLPKDYIEQVRAEGLLDFTTISDHSEPLSKREFFENFLLADKVADELVVFPGCECDVTVMEDDRYGIPIKRSGEIVCINSDDYEECASWEEFYDAVAKKPYPICVLAHPQIVGFSKKGLWDFKLSENNTETMKHAVKLIEMGDGSNRQSNQIHELSYSVALDNGFKLSTTCSSDSHGPVWGYHRFPGKTVIMAKERSREAFYDAINNQRIYGCESGNLKLRYLVNGVTAPATLPNATHYEFKINISYFNEDDTTRPVKCQLISDKGKIVKTVEGEYLDDFTFDFDSDSASYFYLRLVDSKHRRTWSPPVFTGRAPKGTKHGKHEPISKQGFTAVDLQSGKDASALINDIPTEQWTADAGVCTVVIDMHREESISALGHYSRVVLRELIKDWYGGTPPILAEFPVEFEISTSKDGVNYEFAEDGLFRVFASEEIIEFAPRTARFVKLVIKSNVATFAGLEEYKDKPVSIGELTIYK